MSNTIRSATVLLLPTLTVQSPYILLANKESPTSITTTKVQSSHLIFLSQHPEWHGPPIMLEQK